MATPEQLQWVDIEDFTPGIWYPLYGYGAAKAPPGAAQEYLTYRCVAGASGALIPAPASSYNFTQSMLGTGTRPASADKMVMCASGLFSGVHPNTASAVPATRPDTLTIVWGQFRDPASGSSYGYTTHIMNYKLWANATPTTYTWTGAALVCSAMSAAVFGGGAFVAPYIQQRASVIETAEEFGGLTLRQAVAVYTVPRGGGADAGRIYCFPDRTTAGTDSVKELTPVYNPKVLVGHQGRVAGWTGHFSTDQDGFGTNAIQFSSANDIIYWSVLDAQTDSETYWNRPIEENQSGVTVVASVNASEMFVVKATNGGAVIRGDLADPRVIRLPGVHSTGAFFCQGVQTPTGFYYGGQNGVYRWTGADVTENISTMIDKRFFWNTSTADSIVRGGYEGQFGFSDPWVLVPNNFMYDTRFNSWWKLDDNTVASTRYFSYHESNNGNFYALRGYVDGTETVVAREFDPETGASSFSWNSQPIFPMPGKTVDIRQVVLVVEGTGTVQVIVTPTYTGEAATTSSAISVDTTANSNLPTVVNFDVANMSEGITVRIVSTGSGGGRAPTIHAMRVGYRTGTNTPKSF